MEVDAAVVLAGRYRLGPSIGRGGMAEVRHARDLRLQRDVAVKWLAGSEAASAARFLAEARTAAAVAHPGIVSVYDVGIEHGRPFIVMEYLGGGTLADEIGSGGMSIGRIVRVLEQVLDALGAAHACGVLHRDLKPSNVLFTLDGRAKLGDFGIAVHRRDAEARETHRIVGTPAYLAPECLAGAPATHRSDLYAAGVLGYEALTGVCPFGGASVAEVVDAVRHAVPRRLRELRPEVPEALAAAVERAISREPRARFDSAGAFARALDPGRGSEIHETRPIPLGALPHARAVSGAHDPTVVRTRREPSSLAAIAPAASRRGAATVIASMLTIGGLTGVLMATIPVDRGPDSDGTHSTTTVPGTTAPSVTTVPAAPPVTATTDDREREGRGRDGKGRDGRGPDRDEDRGRGGQDDRMRPT